MNAMMIDCDGCNAEAGEPCREGCLSLEATEEVECTHSLCIEGTRRWPAKYVVTQVGPTYRWVTYTCKTHTEVMREVLREHDTVERLHVEA